MEDVLQRVATTEEAIWNQMRHAKQIIKDMRKEINEISSLIAKSYCLLDEDEYIEDADIQRTKECLRKALSVTYLASHNTAALELIQSLEEHGIGEIRNTF